MPTTLERKQAAAAKARKAIRRGKRGRYHPKPTEAIDPVKTYPFALIPDLFGISRDTLRKYQAEGMKAMQAGSRKFVEGKVLIAHMKKRSA